MLVNKWMDIKVCMEEMGLENEIQKEECYWNFVMKTNYVWQTHGFKKKEKKKVTFNLNGNETEIDFVLVGKENRKYLQNVDEMNCSTT